MKKLLQESADALELFVNCHVSNENEISVGNAIVARLRTAIAACSDPSDHVAAILAHADGLEEQGDARAKIIRAILADGKPLIDQISDSLSGRAKSIVQWHWDSLDDDQKRSVEYQPLEAIRRLSKGDISSLRNCGEKTAEEIMSAIRVLNSAR